MLKKILCIIVSMYCLLTPIRIFAEETQQTTYDFNYSDRDYFSSVLQTNIDKIENISKGTAKTYSAEFVIDYISPSRDYNTVIKTLNQVREISNTICNGITDDYQKIKKIHDYVCYNVAYDHISAENTADFNTICLENVIKNKRTICAGYSNFFSALCNAQGLYCINIRGAVMSNDANSDLSAEDTVTNHEWNAVWYEAQNRWIFVDCTWDSNNDYSEDGFTYGNVNDIYFDMSMEKMSMNHKIKIIDHRDFFDAINYFQDKSTETSSIIEETTSKIETTIESSISTTKINSISERTKTTTDTFSINYKMIISILLVFIGLILSVIIVFKK
ncbi:MAG: transglutaminase domain-containing protein [Oscillospiraceae bacterium]